MNPPASGDADDSALAIAAAVQNGTLTATAVVTRALARVTSLNDKVNAFTTVLHERALREARAVDARRAAGKKLPALAGVPYAVKNLFDVEGVVTVAGSKINRDLPAAQADCTLVRRMQEAGAVLVGALNMDEYAFGFTTENSHYGPARNPHDLTRTAGGSSGGSGAAVAAGMAPLTLGTDTNGSIRVPSSLNGIVGVKPTYGRLSRAGSFPFVHSLDHVGPFARTIADLAATYDALQGLDAADPVQANRPAEPVSVRLSEGLGKLRVSVAGGYFHDHAGPDAREAVSLVAQALGHLPKVEIPEAQRARAAAFVITATEGSQLHLGNLRRRPQDFEPLIRDRLLANAHTPAAWYAQAQRFRRWYCNAVMKLFADTDIIIAAATPVCATTIGAETFDLNGVEVPTRPSMGLLTQPISFIGVPVVTVPVWRPGKLPLGVQLIAAPWREVDAFRVAAHLEAQGVVKSELASL